MKIQKNLALILMMVTLLSLFSTPVWAQEADGTTAVAAITTTAQQEETTAADTETTTAGEAAATTVPTRIESGSSRTTMIILELGGKIAARVTDANGNPVEGILVGLQLGTTQMPGEYTDADGYATFRYAFPGDNTYIYCYSEETDIDGVIYKAASAAVGKQPAGVTTATLDAESDETTPRTGSTASRTTRKSTTKKSTTTTKPLTTYTAPGTTGLEDAFVVLDFCFDSGILESFGIEQQEFASTARLLLEQESYNTIMGEFNGILMLSAATSKNEVTDEQIEAALVGDAMLSRVKVSGVSRIVMDLSLQYREAESGELIPVWNTAEGSYVFRLPVPDSMRSAQTVAVSAVTADGISEPVMATVSNGILRFETSSPVGTIVVLGFKSGLLGALTAQGARSSLVFLGVGLVCIGIAVFLFFRFVRQPKKAKKKVDEAVDENATAPVETFVIPLDDDPTDAPLGGLDTFAESDTVAPPKNPADYDIEL